MGYYERWPPIAIDGGSHAVTNRQRARLQHTDMAVKLIGELAGIADHETLTDTAAQRSGIADLPARLGVERRLVEHHDGILTGRDTLDGAAIDDQRQHRACLRNQRVVTAELRRRQRAEHFKTGRASGRERVCQYV